MKNSKMKLRVSIVRSLKIQGKFARLLNASCKEPEM
jgi:hypothetical protein